jgi:hypothetical protein
MFNGGKVIRPKLRIPGGSLESGKVEINASLEMPTLSARFWFEEWKARCALERRRLPVLIPATSG